MDAPSAITGRLAARARRLSELTLIRHAVILAVFLGMTALLIQTLTMAARPGGNDLSAYLSAAQAVLDGGDPYHTESPFRYIYPVFLAIILAPLTAMPHWAVQLAWFLTAVWGTGWAVRRVVDLTASTTGVGWRTPLWVPAGLVVLLQLDIAQHNLRNGQINPILLTLSVAVVASWGQGRAARAAGLLGAAVAAKLVPAVLLPFLAVRRAWGALFGALLVLAGLLGLPLLVGGDELWSHQAAWVEGMVQERVALDLNGPRQRTDFTLGGQVGRWFDGPGARRLVLGIPLVLTVIADLWRRHKRDGASVALYLAAIPLVTPISEMHHFIWLLPALLTAVLRWGWGPDRGRDLLFAGLLVYVGLHIAGRVDPLGPWYAGACLVAWGMAAGCLLTDVHPEQDP